MATIKIQIGQKDIPNNVSMMSKSKATTLNIGLVEIEFTQEAIEDLIVTYQSLLQL